MWDLIVSVRDHCLSFYFVDQRLLAGIVILNHHSQQVRSFKANYFLFSLLSRTSNKCHLKNAYKYVIRQTVRKREQLLRKKMS